MKKIRITLLSIFSLVNVYAFSQEVNIFWEFSKKDSIIFDCYKTKYEKQNHGSKLVFYPVCKNYFKMYVYDSLNRNQSAFNLLNYSNDTIYLLGGGADNNLKLVHKKEILINFKKDIDTIRKIRPYGDLGTRIQFNNLILDEKFEDSVFLYRSSLPPGATFGTFINLIALNKKRGIIFYTYFDGNGNYFYIRNDIPQNEKIGMIMRLLKRFKNPIYLDMFTKKIIEPNLLE